MSYGANYVHQRLRENLEQYIKSQYFGRSPLLLNAVGSIIDRKGELYQDPYIESSNAYEVVYNGIRNSEVLPEWLKDFLIGLSSDGLGKYETPYTHQLEALESFYTGKDIFVSTGTGSGKTECFMWPMIAKMADEAYNSPDTWERRGVRTIIMYPMNALVSDQISRLRRLIGDKDNKFVSNFRRVCGDDARRPQFGMYTGRTPYPGEKSDSKQDKALCDTLSRLFDNSDDKSEYLEKLIERGKLQAKSDINAFLNKLRKGIHEADPEDAELITRFEMQRVCPDILITNYSMLEYMLLRPCEKVIWDNTKEWLHSNKDHKLLFTIDEAHMYRGSSGGEVALLIRRLFHKLEINRDKVQFILTTASMPHGSQKDKDSVENFAYQLTASEKNPDFVFISGKPQSIKSNGLYEIPFSKFENISSKDFEDNDTRLSALINFWSGIDNTPSSFESCEDSYYWMFDNLLNYRPFNELITRCRGNAVSLNELSADIFPEVEINKALEAVSILLAIAPLARNNDAVLFPARMHMLFRGIQGVYACANKNCPHSSSDNSLTLGKVFINDQNMTCPECGSVVYEIYNDRRCGALFYKGYVSEEDMASNEIAYLWHYPGQNIDNKVKEIHLFIPYENISLKKDMSGVKTCYLDVHSGFLYLKDDAVNDNPNFRKLYYGTYENKETLPHTLTFTTCPHCLHRFSETQLTSLSTRGNQSFFNLVKTQFELQPSIPGKDIERMPNEGRKVLLFSDSRQRAAKLARDMSEISETEASRQLFVIAIKLMEESGFEYSLDMLYDFICLVAAKNHLQMFHDDNRSIFIEHCKEVLENYNESIEDDSEYDPENSFSSNAPISMQKQLIRMFSGGYNTLYDSAVSWLEPTRKKMKKCIKSLQKSGIIVDEEQFLEMFNAWIMYVCDSSTAIGHTISEKVRKSVRKTYDYHYGLKSDWDFSKTINGIMKWKKNSKEKEIWKEVFNTFLETSQENNTGMKYVDIATVRPRYNTDHTWYRCEICSEITPFLLRGHCNCCGSSLVHPFTGDDFKSLEFWQNTINSAINGEVIRVINTEEHTAQLSHKDQRDDMWSKTEKYEMLFQDLIQNDEVPVDILSSTTTMEVGIDIGDLTAVGLRNIPPMRENYQQRAGRAGRRGASLSTIVTFCEDGPHDTLYFKNPTPMFRGDPRRPWIDIHSDKLIMRHLNLIIIQSFTESLGTSLDSISTKDFILDHFDDCVSFVYSYQLKDYDRMVPVGADLNIEGLKSELVRGIGKIKQKYEKHPELFEPDESSFTKPKSLLDAVYEEGIIPTYSFPKNVVSMYISDYESHLKHKVERSLDIAISEYAPGRSIVVDKNTYQIGGLYCVGSERKHDADYFPAKSFIEDKNYNKEIQSCECGWFGLKEENYEECPFCGSKQLTDSKNMIRPWGFAPRNAKSIETAQLEEEYSSLITPLYSTLPRSDNMHSVTGCKNIRLASRTNQRIIMQNKGVSSKGFMVCTRCGAAMPGDEKKVLDRIGKPYHTFKNNICNHECINVDLGFDFITDMLVIEISLDTLLIDVDQKKNIWLARAAQSLAEALRLAASHELDIEFTELVAGYRMRKNSKGAFFDVYLYDSLSSGAGYAVNLEKSFDRLLDRTKQILDCTCDDACHNCLKHYRNQYIHDRLDRNAAMELLNWGQYGTVADDLSIEDQKKCISSLSEILGFSGYAVDYVDDTITITHKGVTKQLVIYPSMRIPMEERDVIYIKDSYVKYAKPYAVRVIKNSFS